MSWFILSVKRSKEKKVADTFAKMGIEVFCPMIKEVKYWSEYEKVVNIPLFKSYVFVKLPDKYRGVIFGVDGVKNYLFFNGKPAIVKDEEIDIINNWVIEDSHDLVLLSKLLYRKEINIEKWLLNNDSDLKWIGNKGVSILLKEMSSLVKEKLRKVV